MASEIRFTKIVATAGPATESEERLRSVFAAGCNVVRLNASHGTAAWRDDLLQRIRRVAGEMKLHVAVLLDLCGPKIRVATLSDDPLVLTADDVVTIGRHGLPEGAAKGFSTTYPAIVDDCRINETILLDDGALRLTVTAKAADRLTCRVAVGGRLLPRKGINLPETVISSPSLTAKDLEDLAWGLAAGVDYVGLSFVRCADDIVDLRRRIREAGSSARIVAKIEKPEAVADIERIVALSDAVMVARGDLGVEMDVAEVPLIQKRITRMAVRSATPVIIATQMLQTMIHLPYPTRAEVSDIANAILDGADAIMLSGETAVGDYPGEAVAVMDRIANLTEDHEKEFGAGRWRNADVARPPSAGDEVDSFSTSSSQAARAEYRRNLPYYQVTGKPLFVTFCTKDRMVLPESVRDIVLRHCVHDHGTRYQLHGAVVMPDHVHMVLTPLPDCHGNPFGVGEIMSGIKGASSHSVNRALGRHGTLWQEEWFDRVLRSDENTRVKVEYVCQNPVRKSLAPTADSYPWLWREWIEGREMSVVPAEGGRATQEGISLPAEGGRATLEGTPVLERALADGAARIAADVGARAIVVLTHSGATAQAVSKQRPDVSIVAISDRIETCRRMALYRGVFAVHHQEIIRSADLRSRVSQLLAEGKWVEPGSTVVIISGQFPDKPGSSDMLQVHRL
ncbi:MAG: pyruvate kinase [Planctomycetes bacterium]|nr:pyruvate kinase [Planctomycetota bacterium]